MFFGWGSPALWFPRVHKLYEKNLLVVKMMDFSVHAVVHEPRRCYDFKLIKCIN
jgi:hypothetical protein